MKPHTAILVALGFASALATTAPRAAFAQESPTTDSATPTHDRGAFVVGLKFGGLFAQPFTEGRLGASFLASVEVGYVLPFVRRGFQLLLDVGYTQPTASGTMLDPRVRSNGGNYDWNMIQRELVTGFTVMYRLTLIGQGRVAPYIGVGPRLFFLQTVISGSAGASVISESREQSMRFGLSVPLGVDIGLGPGRVFIEALMLWAPVQHRITGDSSVGSINALAGYRLML